VFGFSLQRLSWTFLILRRIQRDIVVKVHRSPSKVHRSPSKVHRSPSKVHRSPSKVYRSPSKVHRSSSKVLDVLLRCYWNFTDRFSKNTQISNFVKIHLFGAELFHADEQTQRLTDGCTDRHDGGKIRFFSILQTRRKDRFWSLQLIIKDRP
jgi:hypothetical protein